MKKLFYSILVIALALAVVLPATPVLACHMDIGVTITAHWTKTFDWTIEKSVTPDVWNFQEGGSGTSTYTITVAKDSGTDEAWVDGVITVTNYLGETVGIAITAKLYRVGLSSPINTTVVDVSSNNSLTQTETGTYNYSIVIPTANINAAYDYNVKVEVNTTPNCWGIHSDFSPNATLPAPTLINDSINVDDTNGGSWAFSASGSETYNKTFTCANEGNNENIATIRETNQSDNAIVTVTCEGGGEPQEEPEVGGDIYPINKVMMLTPIIVLTIAFLSVTGIVIWRRQTQR